eukprot:gene3694-biopygen2225
MSLMGATLKMMTKKHDKFCHSSVDSLSSLASLIGDLSSRVEELEYWLSSSEEVVIGGDAPTTERSTDLPQRVQKAAAPEVLTTVSSTATHQKTVEVFGGDFISGKTSNVELDAIFQKYLPPGKTLPCATLPNIGDAMVRDIRKRLDKRRRLYFPVFVRHHWVAGVLRKNGKGKEFLELYDSAPSEIVLKDIRRRLLGVWPSLAIHRAEEVDGLSPRQIPGSEDCGLFMAAAFFGDHLDAVVASPQTIGSRLRKLLDKARKTDMDKSVFLDLMETELWRQDNTPLEGAGPRKRKRAFDPFVNSPPQTDDEETQSASHRQRSAQRPMPQRVIASEDDDETFRLQAEEEEEHASSQPHSAPLIGAPLASSQPTEVETSVNSVLHIPRDEVQRAQQRGTAHFQVAAALNALPMGAHGL